MPRADFQKSRENLRLEAAVWKGRGCAVQTSFGLLTGRVRVLGGFLEWSHQHNTTAMLRLKKH